LGRRDDSNLYAYVGDDPADKTDSGGLAGCGSFTGDDCNTIKAAQNEAIKDVQAARSDLQDLKAERAEVAAGTRDGLSDAAKSTESQLNSYFKSADNKIVDKVDSILAKAQSVLEDNGSKYNYASAPVEKDQQGHAVMAWTSFMSSKIRLTPDFFSNPSLMVRNLIHEPPHIFGINAFQKETYGNSAVLKLSGPRALNNADSYAQYVLH
jgi:ElaB/YqjD/DUF883 family membrane-anchored ribosome-binding protein